MTDLISIDASKLSWTVPELQPLAWIDAVASGTGALNDGQVEDSTSGVPN